MTAPPLPKPGPTPTALSQPFWDAAQQGRLTYQRCGTCAHAQLYPRQLCTQCWGEDLRWDTASGLGTVWTYTIVHKPGHPAWLPETPYVVAIVELTEGPRLVANILGCPPGEVHIGQSVVATFEPREGYTAVQFLPHPTRSTR